MDTPYKFSRACRALEALARDLPEPAATGVRALTLALGAIVEVELNARVTAARTGLDGAMGEALEPNGQSGPGWPAE